MKTLGDIERTFMVMWSIPETFGGMTSMCLRRAHNFETVLGRATPVLCFQLVADTRVLTESLIHAGHLAPEMQIWNVFAHYRVADLRVDPHRSVSVPLPAESARPQGTGLTNETVHDDAGRLFAKVTKTEANLIVYRECLRADGSTYFLDVSSLNDDGSIAGRDLWLIDPEGVPVRHFSSPTRFYHYWLDELSRGQPSAFVFDDKRAARVLRGYERKHAVKLVVVHSNHVASGGDPMRGRMDPNRELILAQQQQWDGVVFLTEDARDDYQLRFGATDNHLVIANPSEPPKDEPAVVRDPARGVMVARLRRGKNIAAALKAIDIARRSVPHVHLDVFGEGDERAALEAQIAALDLSRHVTLHGHVSEAAAKFAGASFSLVTSHFEGFAVVLLESMARGCAPIAFDLNYGPRSIVTDDVDGDVVPRGDVAGLAARIVRRCLEPETSRRLGQAAQRRSLDFTHEAVTRQWVDVIASVWKRHGSRQRAAIDRPRVQTHRMRLDQDGAFELEGVLRWEESTSLGLHKMMSLRLQALPDKAGAPIDLPLRVTSRAEQTVRFEAWAEPTHLAALDDHGSVGLHLIAVAGDAYMRQDVPAIDTEPTRLAPVSASGVPLKLVRVIAPSEPEPEPSGSFRWGRRRL